MGNFCFIKINFRLELQKDLHIIEEKKRIAQFEKIGEREIYI